MLTRRGGSGLCHASPLPARRAPVRYIRLVRLASARLHVVACCPLRLLGRAAPLGHVRLLIAGTTDSARSVIVPTHVLAVALVSSV